MSLRTARRSSRMKRGQVLSRGEAIPRQANRAHPDYVLLGLVVGLSLFGLLMVYDASVVVAAAKYGSKFYFVQQQGFNLLIGLAGMFVASKIDYHWWRRLALPLMVVGFMLLFAVFIPGLGVTVYGAKRWLNVGVTTLQPAYMLCFALIVYFASWLSRDEADNDSWHKTLVPFGVILGLALGVVMVLQKDLGTGLIMAITGLSVYFLAGAPLKYFGIMFPAGLGVGSLVILLEPYRLKRLFTFANRDQDVLGASYHINQVLIALGSGGWLGVGLGQSRQKYQYIPEVQTDSIFAILGEELGFFGAAVLIGIFFYVLWRGLRIAMTAPDMLGRLLAGGIMALLGVQVFINLFAMAALIPLTGVPLPFISNGGTSLIVLLFSMGIVLNISKQAAEE